MTALRIPYGGSTRGIPGRDPCHTCSRPMPVRVTHAGFAFGGGDPGAADFVGPRDTFPEQFNRFVPADPPRFDVMSVLASTILGIVLLGAIK